MSRMKTGTILALAAAAAAGAWAYLNRTRARDRIAPELRVAATRIRTPDIGPIMLHAVRALSRRHARCVEGVSVETRSIATPDGAEITLHIYRPAAARRGGPVMLHTHGGGMIGGSVPGSQEWISGYARDLGMVVVSTEYRLAPEHPFPTPLDDVHTGYRWLLENAGELDVDPQRIVVAGESAGGGLTAGLCQRLLDEGERLPVLQILIYPMLDDRTALHPAAHDRGQIGWTPGSNLFAWTSYLGRAPRVEEAPDYAAPARRQDLSGLPPAWIGVGTLDLFYEEDITYAARLRAADVPCELVEVQGAYHAFDLLIPCALSRDFRQRFLRAARRATATE